LEGIRKDVVVAQLSVVHQCLFGGTKET